MKKQEIFDQYAQGQGYKNWSDLIDCYGYGEFPPEKLDEHIFNATNLVCKQVLENAYQNTPEIAIRNNEWGTIKQSITNLKNIPK